MKSRLWRWFSRLSPKIRSRLLLVNLLIVAVPIVGIGYARSYERELLRRLEDDMIHQAQMLREVLQTDPDGLQLARRSDMLRRIARHNRARIRLLDANGHVCADSHSQGPPEGREPDPPQFMPSLHSSDSSRWLLEDQESTTKPVDFSSRIEVQRALAGQYGAASRLWENGNRLFLFSALPIVRDGHIEAVVYVTRSTNPVRASMYRLRTSLIYALLAALIVTGVLSWFFASTIARPLTRLTSIAKRIAAGDRSQTLVLGRRDEIGELADAVDVMAHKLDARANDVAELAANLSHEFKSPLTSIRGAAELILDSAADDVAARTRFLHNILADADRLDKLVTRLLELSRLEADQSPMEAIDYRALVDETVACYSGVKIEVDFAATDKRVRGRRLQLHSILTNLLDNAQQHAHQASIITVRVYETNSKQLMTEVINEGKPISTASMQRMWDRFYTTRSDLGGTGLGLPIVKSLVEAHGGRISAECSDNKTVFRFTLYTFDVQRRTSKDDL